MPLGADYVSLSALQAQAVLAATGRTERDLAEIVVRSRRDAKGNPNAAVSGDFTVDDLLAKDYVVAPLREHDIGPPVDGAAAIVLVAGDRARDLCRAAGVDRGHRPPRRPALPGRARSRDVAVHHDRPASGPASARAGSRSRS